LTITKSNDKANHTELHWFLKGTYRMSKLQLLFRL